MLDIVLKCLLDGGLLALVLPLLILLERGERLTDVLAETLGDLVVHCCLLIKLVQDSVPCILQSSKREGKIYIKTRGRVV